MRELFALMKELSQKLGITFVFKEHPSSRKSYEDLKRKQNKHLIFANNYSTQELIQKASMVITINSTVGIESLLFHKKVITLGEAFYNITGIVKHIKNKNELEKALQEGFEIDFDLVDRFLSYLYYDYLIEGNLKAFNEQSVKMRLCQ
jgi:capsular polysaccharide export protein